MGSKRISETRDGMMLDDIFHPSIFFVHISFLGPRELVPIVNSHKSITEPLETNNLAHFLMTI